MRPGALTKVHEHRSCFIAATFEMLLSLIVDILEILMRKEFR